MPPLDRPTRNTVLMEAAFLMSSRSTCYRLQVGAIFGINGRIIVGGYNGAPSKMPHCEEATCNPDNPCTNTQHAEANAIAFAARHGLKLEGSSAYLTDSPCRSCAMLLINAGVEAVYYATEYRDRSGVELLKAGFIRTVHYDPRQR